MRRPAILVAVVIALGCASCSSDPADVAQATATPVLTTPPVATPTATPATSTPGASPTAGVPTATPAATAAPATPTVTAPATTAPTTTATAPPSTATAVPPTSTTPTATPTVPPPTPTPTAGSLPQWLQNEIVAFENREPTNPPMVITRWTYEGETVYYFPPYCCDFPGELYNAAGALLCLPDGGLTGDGDGRCTDFHDTRTGGAIVWQDAR